MICLGPAANVDFVPKFHVAPHALHAALTALTSKYGHKVASHMSTTKFLTPQHTKY